MKSEIQHDKSRQPSEPSTLSKKELFNTLESLMVNLRDARHRNDAVDAKRLEVEISYVQRAIEIKIAVGER